nr:8-oxo-dGTP diphosphatase [uncultured bacterium]
MTIVVAAGVVEDDDGRFLVTRRQAGAHLEGYWEFPGGKCEPDETPVVCLAREIREELGVEALVGAEILCTRHAYPDREVVLHFLRCRLQGAPVPQLGQEMRWVSRVELGQMSFPPADVELIQILAGPQQV